MNGRLKGTICTAALICAGCVGVELDGESRAPVDIAPAGPSIAVGGSASSDPRPATVELDFPRPADPIAVSACQFEASGSDAAVMALTVDDELWLVDGNGDSHIAYTFGEGFQSHVNRVWASGPVARGDFIAAWATIEGERLDDQPYAPVATGHEIALFDRDGEVLWTDRMEPSDTWYWLSVHLSANGTLVIDRAGELVVVSVDGASHTVSGVRAIAEAAPWGEVPVQINTQSGPYADEVTYDWLDPASGARRPLAHEAVGEVPVWVGDAIVYFTGTDVEGTTAVVIETQSDSHVIPLEDELDPYAYPSYAVLDAVPEGHALVGSRWGDDSRWLLDVGAGSAKQLDITVPEGLRDFDRTGYYYVDPGMQLRLDDQGGLLVGLRDDERGALYRSTDGGSTWAPVGSTVSHTMEIIGLGIGGTFAIESAEFYDYYGGTNESAGWPEGEAADIRGAALQIVRPTDGTELVLASDFGQHTLWNTFFTPDGRCMAYWDVTEGTHTLWTVDLEHGSEIALLTIDADRVETGVGLSWVPGAPLRRGRF